MMMNRDQVTENALRATRELTELMIHALQTDSPEHYRRARAFCAGGAPLELVYRFENEDAASILLCARDDYGNVHEFCTVKVSQARIN